MFKKVSLPVILPIISLYLSIEFWALFTDAMPVGVKIAGVSLVAIVIHSALRWLGGQEMAPTGARPTLAQWLKTGLLAPDQRHVFRMTRKGNCRKVLGDKGNFGCSHAQHSI